MAIVTAVALLVLGARGAIAAPIGVLTQLAGPAGCVAQATIPSCTNTGRALEAPSSVVVSPDGRNAYVAGYGKNAVAVFDRDPSTGKLAQKAGTAGCIVDAGSPVAGCDNTGRALAHPSWVTVSPDGRSVYLASYTIGAVAVFDRDPSTGGLTQKAGTSGCIARASNPVAGCDNTGRALEGASSVTVSPDGRSAYVTAYHQNAIAVFDRDPSTGGLSQKAGNAGCIVTPPFTIAGCDNTGRALGAVLSLTLSPDGKNAYTVSSNGGAMAVFDRDTSTGELTQKAGTAGCIVNAPSPQAGCDNTGRALAGAYSVVVSADGKNAYIASFTDRSVAVFDRDPSTGALTQKAGAAGCIAQPPGVATCANIGRGLLGAVAIAASGDGRNVYVASFSGDVIPVFDRDTSTGALTQKAGTAGCISQGGGSCTPGRALDGPRSVTVSPDGRNAYVVSSYSSAVAVFGRECSAFGASAGLQIARREQLRLGHDGSLRLRLVNLNRFAVEVRAVMRTVRRISGKRRRLAQASLSLGARKRRALTLKLPDASRRLLARRRSIYVYVTILVSADGEQRQAETAFTLRTGRDA